MVSAFPTRSIKELRTLTGSTKSATELKILGALCALILCGILTAGLWPFHSPTNQVTWLNSADGLRFGRLGTILSSSGAFTTSGRGDRSSCALEIRIEATPNSDHTLLAFYTPEHPLQFLMRRYRSGIVLRSEALELPVQDQPTEVYFPDVFDQEKPELLTITSGFGGTAVYVNGALKGVRRQFHISSDNFTGRLVLGTSPVESDSWSGELLGLAIYKNELTANQVARHFASWTAKGRPNLDPNDRALALYLFDERQGRTAHDTSGSGINLDIPERYMLVHEKFLETPWSEFRATWSAWKDIGINIGGFIPLGFFFYAYLTMATNTNKPALVTVFIGAATSLTIEVLQAFLPTRDSGMTDLITNTLGTGLGVMLCRWNAALLSELLHQIVAPIVRSAVAIE
jgi:hypothetical protein